MVSFRLDQFFAWVTEVPHACHPSSALALVKVGPAHSQIQRDVRYSLGLVTFFFILGAVETKQESGDSRVREECVFCVCMISVFCVCVS